MGIFTGIALQAQPAGTSRDSSEKSFRFALHSSRYADCSHEERAIDSHTMRYSIYVLNAFGREAFQRTPPREGAPRAGACSLFRCSMLSISLCIKKRFFPCGYSARFPFARACPSCRAGTTFRYEAALSKDSPKDTFGIRLGNSS